MSNDPKADSAELQTAVAEYLRQLNSALAALPADERDAIVRETSQHLDERRATGGIEAAWAGLRAFGPADAYAAQFISDRIEKGSTVPETSPIPAPNNFRSVVAICVTIFAIVALLAAGSLLFRG